MSLRRFSSGQLRYLRNQIPIEALIRSLNGPADLNPRLHCPLCGGRDTAVNKATNLARCFTCHKNFNPIELVMAACHLGFVDAVHLLLDHRGKYPATLADHAPTAVKRAQPPVGGSTANPAEPSAMGDIVPAVLDALRSPQSPRKCEGCKRLEESLAETRQRLDRLMRLVASLDPNPLD